MLRTPLSRAGITAIVAVVAAVGLGSAWLYSHKERARDMTRWNDTLNFVADSGAQDVNTWVNQQFNELNNLANNASLPIYFMQLQNSENDAPSAQGDYVRNQLTLTAQRLGFEPSSPTIDQQVKANVNAPSNGGLALVDKNFETLVTSGSMQPLSDTVINAVKEAPAGKASMVDLSNAGNGAPRVAFVVPLYAMQAEHTPANQIGSIVGVRMLDAPFFAMLQPKTSARTLELALVKPEGNQLRYITNAGSQSRSEAGGASAAAFAATTPNALEERQDYNGNNVFVTGRTIENTRWSLLAKVDSDEVLAQSAAWRNTISAIVLLLTALVAATIVAISRSGAARESAAVSSERETRLKTLNQLVTVLVSLVDRRDPNAAQHSAYTALVAAATARELQLDARTIETTETAARLLNLGKMDVPTELLTRKAALNDAERNSIRSSLSTTATLLEGIAFDGPVADTLRQAQEHVDGSGPLGLKGDQILISARIVAASNALIGMLSPRAWRESMSFDEAQRVLLQDIDSHYDRKVVSAMMNYLDNHGGKQALQGIEKPAEKKVA